MIRIDEIYSNTFWPWVRDNRPGFRLFFCAPFGCSDSASVINHGKDDWREHNYIFFFDQEPIHLNIHTDTFQYVFNANNDINANQMVQRDYIENQKIRNRMVGIIKRPLGFVAPGYLCTSEKNSENVEKICAQYNWKQLYYFFHGWAALDWYRGYDKTFLITPPNQRKIIKTFIAPNRIIGGAREHRLEMLYHIFKNKLLNNHISCPDVCPAENISIHQAIKLLVTKCPDIETVFANTALPMHFRGETDHPMHSCWLSLFDECSESLLYLVTETVATGRRHHLTEKTFKPIAMGMPFVIVGTRGSLEYLRSYGFRTFEGIWDESYDLEEDDVRIARIASLLCSLDQLPPEGKQDLFDQAQEVIEHNWNHFYNGGFEKILWAELKEMLNDIDTNSGSCS
jgi:hypothetical protein